MRFSHQVYTSSIETFISHVSLGHDFLAPQPARLSAEMYLIYRRQPLFRFIFGVSIFFSKIFTFKKRFKGGLIWDALLFAHGCCIFATDVAGLIAFTFLISTMKIFLRLYFSLSLHFHTLYWRARQPHGFFGFYGQLSAFADAYVGSSLRQLRAALFLDCGDFLACKEVCFRLKCLCLEVVSRSFPRFAAAYDSVSLEEISRPCRDTAAIVRPPRHKVAVRQRWFFRVAARSSIFIYVSFLFAHAFYHKRFPCHQSCLPASSPVLSMPDIWQYFSRHYRTVHFSRTPFVGAFLIFADVLCDGILYFYFTFGCARKISWFI